MNCCADVAAEVYFFAVAVSAGTYEKEGLAVAVGIVAPDFHCC